MDEVSIYGSTFIVMVVVVIVAMHKSNLMHTRSYLRRAALVDPELSPWRKLFESMDDSSFLRITGFNYPAFRELSNSIFTDTARLREQTRTGRRSNLCLDDKLGLYLLWVGSSMSYKQIALLFGVLEQTVSTTVIYMMKLILKKLKRHHAAAIRKPTENEMSEWADIVNRRANSAVNVIGFLDGCAFPIECSSEDNEAYYNGYQGTTTVNNLFCFNPRGIIFHAMTCNAHLINLSLSLLFKIYKSLPSTLA